MNINFNQELLNRIEQLLPAKSEQLDLIIEEIGLGKEAAYRRLRGDVLFSFEEACKIANRLGISLNSIAQNTQSAMRHSSFQLCQVTPNEIDDYCYYYYNHILSRDEKVDLTLQDPSISIMSMCCNVPHTMLMPYPALFRFRAFQWIFQVDKKFNTVKLADVKPSPELLKRQRELVGRFSEQYEQIFIFDRRIFTSFGEEIRYLCDSNLISDDERAEIKEEFHAMINQLETIAISGKTANFKYVWLFLSNIDFETNYTYIRGKNFERSYLGIYQMNTLVSTDPKICKRHCEWIESLRKYSTLISVSSEKERKLYFEQQREQIEKILGNN